MGFLMDDEETRVDADYKPMLRYTIELSAIAALMYLLIKFLGIE